VKESCGTELRYEMSSAFPFGEFSKHFNISPIEFLGLHIQDTVFFLEDWDE